MKLQALLGNNFNKNSKMCKSDLLILSVLIFFRCFCHLQKIGGNSADFSHKNTKKYEMKDIAHGYLLVASIFEITSEKVENFVYKNPIF